MKFSIAIPVYEMKDKGLDFLNFSFEKLNSQTFKDFEIVISDHSENDEIKKLCERWEHKLKIRYLKNLEKRGSSSSNLNNALKNCRGEWIKILFQDDFLYSDNSLEILNEKVNLHNQSNWFVSSSEHSNDGYNFYRTIIPKWNSKIYLGNNTFSSPSVLTIRNKEKLFFDENLIWLMDVDYYKKLYDRNGEPVYIEDVLVVNRTWGDRLSDNIGEELKQKELQLLIDRYERAELIFDNLCRLNFDKNTLYSRGIVDINEHLPTLRRYASKCEHITEMGTRFAISTMAFIISKPTKFVSIDLNYHFFKPFESEIQKFSEICGTTFDFKEADVLEMEIEQTDLLFIDTLHTYEQLSLELTKHESKVNKWIILHDTVTFGYIDEEFYTNGQISNKIQSEKTNKKGLVPALNDFLEKNKNWRTKEHFTNNNGLTIIERTNK